MLVGPAGYYKITQDDVIVVDEEEPGKFFEHVHTFGTFGSEPVKFEENIYTFPDGTAVTGPA